MRIVHVIRMCMVTSAVVGMLLPIHTTRASQNDGRQRFAVTDVSLQDGGRFTGEVRDAAGKPTADTDVLLVHRESGQHYQTVTDQAGRFSFAALGAGLYQLQTAHATLLCRCWAPKTAPPAARGEVLIVSDESIERGQRPLAEALFSTPTLLCLMIVAAIAIPIAVHNSNRDDAS